MTVRLQCRLAGVLLRCYPPAWRVRYGDEMRAMLDEHPVSARALFDLGRSVVRENLWPSAGSYNGIRAVALRLMTTMAVSFAVYVLTFTAFSIAQTGRPVNPFMVALGLSMPLLVGETELVRMACVFWLGPLLMAGTVLAAWRLLGGRPYTNAAALLTSLAPAVVPPAFLLWTGGGWTVLSGGGMSGLAWFRLLVASLAGVAIGLVLFRVMSRTSQFSPEGLESERIRPQ